MQPIITLISTRSVLPAPNRALPNSPVGGDGRG